MRDEVDSLLLRRVFDGDRRAWDEFYLLNHRDMFQRARTLSGSEAEAEDLEAAFWLDVVQVIRRAGEVPREVKPWMFRIMKNNAIDMFVRRASRRREVPHHDPARDESAWTPNPDDRLCLMEFLAIASEVERAVIAGLYDGESVTTIATRLGRDESSVRARIKSIRRWLEGTRTEAKRAREP